MMITSEQDIRLVDKTFAAGATLFLRKPFSHSQLKSMLHMLVSQSND
jgi:FixJ family two-component response regulator